VNTSDTPVIQTDNLTKTYKGVYALSSLNLSVHKNSIFGFLGPNGAGKTTTIKLLLGLASPTSGSAKVFGLDLVKDSPQIRQRVGYLAQDPRYYEHMTARQTLRFAASFFFSGPKAAVEDRVEETLELVGLSDKADRSIKGFSGGERQRLGIAQAQINYPDLLILDEPAASLDPMGRHDVLEVMERLRKHTTIFYSTHILSDVQRVSDTVAILNHGKLVAQASIDELLAGSGGVTYAVTVKGQNGTTERAQQHIAAQPWVSGLSAAPVNGSYTGWTINVSDETAAENQLFKLLAAQDVVVTEFGRKKYDLEQVFMGIVEGNNNGNQ
jgi:ABC-2 type transport system ATP-binding protein